MINPLFVYPRVFVSCSPFLPRTEKPNWASGKDFSIENDGGVEDGKDFG